ncbi:MAG: ornithine carbamoyltransferase [Stellaceae bacterium]
MRPAVGAAARLQDGDQPRAAQRRGDPGEDAPRHFLDIDQLAGGDLRSILDLGFAFKKGQRRDRPLAGKTLAMIFEKPSTRTRVSFEVAMRQLGGETIVLGTADSQLGRGESVADTARVLSRYVDAIMIRTHQPQKLDELAAYAGVPVINGLTDASHPCQLMADVMTLQERKGPLASQVVAWSGDGNNVAASWIHAAVRFGFTLRLACPPELVPPPRLLAWAAREGGRVSVTAEPGAAVAGADCVVTDTWVSMGVSMGVEANINRHNLLAPYRVDESLMAQAKPDAVFMHCLPAKRGQEVTAGIIDGPQSVVWDEAENRLHAQKGILVWCLG